MKHTVLDYQTIGLRLSKVSEHRLWVWRVADRKTGVVGIAQRRQAAVCRRQAAICSCLDACYSSRFYMSYVYNYGSGDALSLKNENMHISSKLFAPPLHPPPLRPSFLAVCFLQPNLIGLIRYNMMYAFTIHVPVHQSEENVNKYFLKLTFNPSLRRLA